MKASHRKVLDALRIGYVIKPNKHSRKFDVRRAKYSNELRHEDGFTYVKYLGEDVLFTILERTFLEMIGLKLIEYSYEEQGWIARHPD